MTLPDLLAVAVTLYGAFLGVVTVLILYAVGAEYRESRHIREDERAARLEEWTC